jgi:hypothetical protein
MAPGQLQRVRAVRAAEKYFDIRLDELLDALRRHSGKFELRGDIELVDPATDARFLRPLKLKVSGSEAIRETWDIALIFENVRIDGVGYEESYIDANGTTQSGWHRHIWIERESSALAKLPECDLNRAASLEQFVLWGLSKMRVELSRGTAGGQALEL